MESYDTIGMAMAIENAERGTCRRKKVGAALLTSTGRHVADGFNTSLEGQPTCLDVGCLILNNHCVRTVHAEVMAICYAARIGRCTYGGTIYVTLAPCFPCFKVIASSGIKRIVFAEQYGTLCLDDDCKKLGIELVHYKEST